MNTIQYPSELFSLRTDICLKNRRSFVVRFRSDKATIRVRRMMDSAFDGEDIDCGLFTQLVDLWMVGGFVGFAEEAAEELGYEIILHSDFAKFVHPDDHEVVPHA